MAERVRDVARPRGVSRGALHALTLLLLAGLLVGCGSASSSSSSSSSSSDEPAGAAACPDTAAPRPLGRIDVDGDGKPEQVAFHEAASGPGGDCAATDVVAVGDGVLSFDDELPVRPRDLRAVTIPGRPGKLVLLVQRHPRGGFVAYLGAYDGAGISGIPADDTPLVPFVATDAPTHYVSAACTSAGFALTEATLTSGSGAGWDVTRTAYENDGPRLVARTPERLDAGLTDASLRARYPDVVQQRLFAECGGFR